MSLAAAYVVLLLAFVCLVVGGGIAVYGLVVGVGVGVPGAEFVTIGFVIVVLGVILVLNRVLRQLRWLAGWATTVEDRLQRPAKATGSGRRRKAG